MAKNVCIVMRCSSLLLTISSLFLASDAHILARAASQKRNTYNGGWALGIPGSSCPADAPVACDTGNGVTNPSCCPSGQTCFGLTIPHCCPTNTECSNVVTNLPVCANSSWNMYQLNLAAQEFFCCEPGQYGVLPISGFTGICEYNDQIVASSLLATSATQVGAAAPSGNTVVVVQPATTTAVTSTLAGGVVTTILTTIAGATSTATNTQTGSSASSTGGSSSGNSNSNVAKKSGLSTGTIVGIAVGALLVILIALVLFLIFKRRRPNSNYPGQAPGPTAQAVYSPVPQPYQGQNPPDDKIPVTQYASPVPRYGGNPQTGQYPPNSVSPHPASSVSPASARPPAYGGSPPPPNAVEAPQRWDGRVELG